MTGVDTVPVDEIRRALSVDEQVSFAPEWRARPLCEWVMDAADAMLRHLFGHFRPRRHLEFGTWRGDGVLRCVEECDAAVWTINVLQGESRPDGVWGRTDSYGLIGWKYLKADWGKRVCQIFADTSHIEELRGAFTRLFWVEPSWPLFGIRST